jgi:outer membrane protein assembly factor BamB
MLFGVVNLKTHQFVFCCLVTSILASASWSADWPQFHGPQSDNISKEKLKNTTWNTTPPRLVWKTDLTDDGYSGPSVAKGKVYIVDHSGENDILRCIDLKTGKNLWKSEYPNPKAPDYGYTRSTPTVKNGLVFTLNRWGLVVCTDAKTGKQIWTRDTYADYPGFISQWGHGSSIVVDGKQAIVVPGGKDASMVALDTKTGKTIWAGGGSDPAGWSTPILATINGKRQYISFTSSSLSGVDTKDGKVLWQFEYKTPLRANMASPLLVGNNIFVTASYNMGCAMVSLNPDGTVVPLWRNKAIQGYFTTPVFVDGYIYGISDPQNLVCVDPADGSVKWTQPGFERGPVMAIGGYLLALAGDTGQLALIKPDANRYNELGRFTPLGGTSWTSPAFSDGYLLVRNQKSLACFDMR